MRPRGTAASCAPHHGTTGGSASRKRFRELVSQQGAAARHPHRSCKAESLLVVEQGGLSKQGEERFGKAKTTEGRNQTLIFARGSERAFFVFIPDFFINLWIQSSRACYPPF